MSSSHLSVHFPTSARPTQIVHGNALRLLAEVPADSVHLVVTDPPYFIDGMGDDWSHERLQERTARASVVGSLPVGMKFDPAQGRNFQAFMSAVAGEALRILKPGGFFISFSQARLYHRMAVAVEDAGFEVRDMLGWKYEGQAKAFSMNHFVERSKHFSDDEKAEILRSLGGRKTPQLKPQIEPMVLAQKPKDGTFVENWLRHETGLVDTTASIDGKFPGNIMTVSKPSALEKGTGNEHLTVKPVRLIEHLICLFSKEGQVVVDPFLGSGTTALAARSCNRLFLGFEIEREYVRVAQRRLEMLQ